MFRRWSAVLTHLALTTGDPRQRIIAAHTAGEWARAVQAFEEAFAGAEADTVPLADTMRCLDGLAKTGDRDRYRHLLSVHGLRIGARPWTSDRLNEFVRGVKSATCWVVVEGRGSGSGFLVTARHVVTNRHVVDEQEWGSLVDPGQVRVSVAGEWRQVRTIRQPKNAVAERIDLAVLELSSPLDVSPVRVGYSRLVEIGEAVLALGFPTPEGESFDENLRVLHGIVNGMRSRRHGPELELQLRVNPGMSGGPVFNDCGEVIGVVTMTRFVTLGSSDQKDRTSHAIAIDPLAELLPPPWEKSN